MGELQVYPDMKAIIEIVEGKVKLGAMGRYKESETYYWRKGGFTMMPEQARQLAALLLITAEEADGK